MNSTNMESSIQSAVLIGEDLRNLTIFLPFEFKDNESPFENLDNRFFKDRENRGREDLMPISIAVLPSEIRVKYKGK